MTSVAVPAILVLVLAWLTGCAHFEPKPISPAQTATKLEGRSLTDEGLRAYLATNGVVSAWPRPSWDLNALTLAAFYYNPELNLARARWGTAQAGRGTAAERPNPTLNVMPGYNTTTPVPSPWLVTVFPDVPIETAGKRGYRIAQAEHLSEAARLNLASAAWQVRSRLRRSLVDLSAAGEMERLLREQQGLQMENLRLLELQKEAGAISAFELTQARMAADSSRLALRDAERQTAEARVQVAEAIGVPARALDNIQLSFAEVDQVPPELTTAEARRQALLSRTDILGALATYAAAESALQLEIAKQYPDIHLNPGYEFDQGDNKWNPGLTVTLPVLSQNKGPIAEAEARRMETAAAFNALQARVLIDIDRAVTSYQGSLRQRADAEALLTQVQQQERRAQWMLDAGGISRSELAALRLQLSASALARQEALARVQRALGQLEDALQSPVSLSDQARGAMTSLRPDQAKNLKP